jgi:hypothetical protein
MDAKPVRSSCFYLHLRLSSLRRGQEMAQAAKLLALLVAALCTAATMANAAVVEHTFNVITLLQRKQTFLYSGLLICTLQGHFPYPHAVIVQFVLVGVCVVFILAYI